LQREGQKWTDQHNTRYQRKEPVRVQLAKAKAEQLKGCATGSDSNTGSTRHSSQEQDKAGEFLPVEAQKPDSVKGVACQTSTSQSNPEQSGQEKQETVE
jgi:hypothetical protein